MKSILFSAVFLSVNAFASGPLTATCRSVGPIQGHHNGHGVQGPIRIRLSYAWTKAAGRYDLDYTGPTYTLGNGRHFNIRVVAAEQTARPEHFNYSNPSAAVSVSLTIQGSRGELRYSDGKPINLMAKLICVRHD